MVWWWWFCTRYQNHHDSIAYCPSGLINSKYKGHVLSYLHKAIKPVNQLRMIEDALVIYRISRAMKEEYSILMLVTYQD